jgi:hypothetical protein
VRIVKRTFYFNYNGKQTGKITMEECPGWPLFRSIRFVVLSLATWRLFLRGWAGNTSVGWIEVRGLAWSGRGKRCIVEVNTDAGRTWQKARLQEPILDKTLTAFRHLWLWDGNETGIMSRAVDETGYTQPTMSQWVVARGSDLGGYHMNPATTWLIQRDSQVLKNQMAGVKGEDL